jgi:hypothetical protein
MESKEEKKKERKPDYDRLSVSIQVLLKPSEAKIFERLRRESTYPTNASYARAILINHTRSKKQTELF